MQREGEGGLAISISFFDHFGFHKYQNSYLTHCILVVLEVPLGPSNAISGDHLSKRCGLKIGDYVAFSPEVELVEGGTPTNQCRKDRGGDILEVYRPLPLGNGVIDVKQEAVNFRFFVKNLWSAAHGSWVKDHLNIYKSIQG